MQYIHRYKSPLGDITEASDGEALIGLWFDGQKYFADTLDDNHKEKQISIFKEVDKWLDIYFSGKKPDFTPPLLMKTTKFRKAVWKIMPLALKKTATRFPSESSLMMKVR